MIISQRKLLTIYAVILVSPIAGPDDSSPIEVGIDLTSLLKKFDHKKDGSSASGELHECALRIYDPKGAFRREQKIDIFEGGFSGTPLKVPTEIGL